MTFQEIFYDNKYPVTGEIYKINNYWYNFNRNNFQFFAVGLEIITK